MKNFTAYFFLSIYLLSSVGLTINYHYCMGDLVEFKLYSEVHKCCGEADESPCDSDCIKDGCCSLGTIFLFSDSDYTVPQVAKVDQDKILLTDVTWQIDALQLPAAEHEISSDVFVGALFRPSSYILNCSFIFYA